MTDTDGLAPLRALDPPDLEPAAAVHGAAEPRHPELRRGHHHRLGSRNANNPESKIHSGQFSGRHFKLVVVLFILLQMILVSLFTRGYWVA